MSVRYNRVLGREGLLAALVLFLIFGLFATVFLANRSTERRSQATDIAPVVYASISGEVTDEQGSPVSGARIDVYQKLGQSKGELVGTTTSIADGSYRVTGFPAGAVQVNISAPKYFQQVVEIEAEVETMLDFSLAGR